MIQPLTHRTQPYTMTKASHNTATENRWEIHTCILQQQILLYANRRQLRIAKNTAIRKQQNCPACRTKRLRQANMGQPFSRKAQTKNIHSPAARQPAMRHRILGRIRLHPITTKHPKAAAPPQRTCHRLKQTPEMESIRPLKVFITSAKSHRGVFSF